MGRILSGIARNSTSPQRAILFFLAMSVVFSLFHWLLFPLLEGTPSLGYGANRLSDPRSVGFLDCLYFSATTQTTVGYGDITPITGLGKVATIIQAAFGYFYLAFLFALFASRMARRAKGTQTYLPPERDGKVLRMR